jgi:hypothetical protein
MGGGYPSIGWEWNFKGIESGTAKYVVDNCPVPMVFSGYEIGSNIKTGYALRYVENTNPIKAGYLGFNTNCPSWYSPCTGEIQSSSSWDQTAVLYAARGAAHYWDLVYGTCQPRASGDGNTWSYSGNNHAYLVAKASRNYMENLISDLMVQPPAQLKSGSLILNSPIVDDAHNQIELFPNPRRASLTLLLIMHPREQL